MELDLNVLVEMINADSYRDCVDALKKAFDAGIRPEALANSILEKHHPKTLHNLNRVVNNLIGHKARQIRTYTEDVKAVMLSRLYARISS